MRAACRPQAHVQPLYLDEAAAAAASNGGMAGAGAEALLERALFGGEGGLAGVLGGAHAAKEAAVRAFRRELQGMLFCRGWWQAVARFHGGSESRGSIPSAAPHPPATAGTLPPPPQVLFSGLGGELAAQLTRRLTHQGVASERIMVCEY